MAIRTYLFEHSPLCVMCEAQGIIQPAVIRDHITPLAEGGSEDDDNTQALCMTCSDRKTLEEARRGVRRWQIRPKPRTR